MTIEWRANDALWSDAVELLCMRRVDGQRRVITAVFNEAPVEPGEVIATPTLRLVGDEAQQIMNELWRIGLRPKNGNGAIAHTEAMQAHLDDMRTLLFHTLEVESTESSKTE